MGDLELLDSIELNSGDSFVIDSELYIIQEDDDVKYWLGDSSSHYIDNTDGISMSNLFDSALPTKESEENDVKLLPAKTGEQTPGNKSDNKSTEESGKDSEKEDTEESDKTFWV